MFSLKNLVSTDVNPSIPWTFKAPIPQEVRGKEGKKLRGPWIENSETDHDCYALIEGLNPHLRISDDSKGDEANPPFKIHGLVGDYDAPLQQDELEKGLTRLDGKLPAYYEKTLSGQARFVWLFEKPVAVPSWKFAVELLKLARKAVKADLLAVGLDVPAWESPNRYYTNSCEWMEVSDYRVPSALVQGWLFEVARKHAWKRVENAVALPLPVVWTELQKLYPLHGWPGEFELESQGPTFWVPESSSPKSAIVKETGIYTFAGHASKPFYSWQDLLGADFVSEYKTKSLGKAVENIYHDGQKFWMRDGLGSWRSFTKEDTASHLSITRKLSAERYKGGPSQVDEALEYIRQWQPIDGAAPCAFQSYGVYSGAGPRILNTHTRRVLAPAEEATPWGESGKFPWLSWYFDYLFDPKEQKDFFLAWLRRLYKGAHDLQMERGQNVFLIGHPGTGKTLLSQNILNKLMSGAVDAQSYLLGESGFNSQLFEVGLWLVDDNSSTVSAQKHAIFSSTIKKLTSNQLFEYNKKFGIPATVEWLGRVFVTANDDEESLRIIPDMELSSLEKSMLFHTTKIPHKFAPDAENDIIIRRELPYFARWLLDWEPPAHTRGTNRYGVAKYHEARLLKKAENSSRSNAFSEILEDWINDYFKDHPLEQHWEGGAYKLLLAFNADDSRRAAVKHVTIDMISRNLATLKGKGAHLESVDRPAGGRVWRIFNPANKK